MNTIYTKGTPIHVRGALLFNHHLKNKNLDRRYETIKEGDKILFSYLTLPNVFNENVISYVGTLPKEFDLHRFIDYDMQFNKSFLEPLRNIAERIGWHTEPVASLDSFFS
jgi:DNA polymerase elongation subunit (family B)